MEHSMAVKTPVVPKQDNAKEPLSPPKDAMKLADAATIAIIRKVRFWLAIGAL